MKNKNNKFVNKSDFVRSTNGRPAKDVVALAAKRGIALTERYIYVIRSADKAKNRRVSTSNDAATSLRRAIAEIGLKSAREVLNDVEKTFLA